MSSKLGEPHLSRRLRGTSQKPRRHARERNDKEVARWIGDEFPRIVREAFARKAHLVFLDESGFVLTPTVRRTMAPRGRTPVLPAWDRRDRLSAISAITLSPVTAHPNLFFRIFPHHVHAEQVVDFLAELHPGWGPLPWRGTAGRSTTRRRWSGRGWRNARGW